MNLSPAHQERMDAVAELCEVTAMTMNSIAKLNHREPGRQIGEIDAQLGKGMMEDPLLTSHRLSRFYLLGAGDFLFSIGKLLELPEPMVASPGVLARASSEYSARAWFLSDTKDSPLKRVAKMWEFMHTGMMEERIGKSPFSTDHEKEFARSLGDWRSSTELPKIKGANNFKQLVGKLAPHDGEENHDRLSQIVHGNALTASLMNLSAQMGTSYNVEQCTGHALFATECGLVAAARVCEIRDGDPSDIETCSKAFEAITGIAPGEAGPDVHIETANH